MKAKDKAVIFLAIFGLFTCLTDGVQASHIRRVLVLNSYHPTYEWTKLIVDGIESTLQQYSERVELDVEYMDTRHFEEDETHYENLYALYKHKARQRQYDVIITSDNDALSFVLQHRNELYPNVPLVFCGVGSFNAPMLEGQSNITGVIEERSVGSTVEIALKFHPSARQVVFVSNAMSAASLQLERQLAEIIERFKGRAEFVKSYLYEFNTAELLKIIGGLGDESIVVFTSSFKDVEGNLYGFEDEAAMLSEQCLAPIYVISKEWLGIGPVVGGKVSSASHQGRTAAEMAIRILDGENAQDIPIVQDSPHRYMFDYIQMKHFGITVSDLPESVIINEPESFYYLYKRQIWAVTAIIVALTAVVIILSVNVLRRMAAERKLRQEREKAQKYLDVAGTIMVVIEPSQKVILINRKGCEILGYGEEEILGRSWFDNFTPESVREQMRASFQRFMAGEKELVKHNERPVLTKSKQEKIIAWHNAVLTDEDGNIVSILASGVDITKRKEAEERLRDYQGQLKSLASELSLTEERERRRIAIELHDRISQSLVISKIKLDTLRASASSGGLAETLGEVCDSLGQTIQNTSLLTFDLSSPILYELGFEAAVAGWLIEQIQERYGLATEFEDDEKPKPLDDDVRILLFRNVRELLINVVKHAKAHKVKVSVRKVNSQVHVSVEDDGVGFNPAELASVTSQAGGFGFFSIRERLEQIGGHLEIESEPGRGTRVTVMAPLKQAEVNGEGQE